jgi:hypothetical protein
VDIPLRLVAHLSELTDALDEPGGDLEAMLSVLLDDLTAAIPSFLGLTMTIGTDGHDGADVSLTLLPVGSVDAVGTSLLVPLDAVDGAASDATVIFYAAHPGAFVDLAADTELALRLDGRLMLDQHFPSTAPLPATPGLTGLTAASTVNRAVGVLLDRGHSAAQARDLLQRRADEEAVTMHEVAQALLDGAARGPGDGPPSPDGPSHV